MITRLILFISVSFILTGCLGHGKTYGYKSYDPCIRCGEGWTFLPNTPSRD